MNYGISGDDWQEGNHGDAVLPIYKPERTEFHKRKGKILSTTWFLGKKYINYLHLTNKINYVKNITSSH